MSEQDNFNSKIFNYFAKSGVTMGNILYNSIVTANKMLEKENKQQIEYYFEEKETDYSY